MSSSQRPFFLSSFLAAFRQQTPPALSAASQTNKHTAQPSSSPSASGARSISSSSHTHSQSQSPQQQPQQRTGGVMNQLPLQSQPHRHHQPHHSPQPHRPGMPIPGSGRRRGSDSSSEGFRDVLGADKWYIGGRTSGGDERFFKLGVVKRVRSQDRLSLDRLSL
ncbi:hypothetical protein F4781DRAFT_404398 [Annulohypoxylon bovei var. microspora]|nr:hypothetical protein F4781DRAFT_404398 [Annulohypoxylon bovei var. microspora]